MMYLNKGMYVYRRAGRMGCEGIERDVAPSTSSTRQQSSVNLGTASDSIHVAFYQQFSRRMTSQLTSPHSLDSLDLHSSTLPPTRPLSTTSPTPHTHRKQDGRISIKSSEETTYIHSKCETSPTFMGRRQNTSSRSTIPRRIRTHTGSRIWNWSWSSRTI